MVPIKLITIPTSSARHVSIDTIDEFEAAILQDNKVKKASSLPQRIFAVIYFTHRILRKFGIDLLGFLQNKFIRSSRKKNGYYFSIMMNIDYYKLFPHLLFSKRNCCCYMFDAWPNTQDNIVRFMNDYKLDRLFISSSQATEILNERIGKNNIYWIPEGIDIQSYKYTDYQKKNIDVLALGRRYDTYHEAILPYLENSSYSYLYEKVKGQLIFPTRSEFVDGLSRAKISICVPSNITHPERAGNIETMTIRYLQSIVSKCLIVGHAPKEMIELFGYNPVIEIDMVRPQEQLEEILKNYATYIPLIEKNYETVLNNHTWLDRWKRIREILKINS